MKTKTLTSRNLPHQIEQTFPTPLFPTGEQRNRVPSSEREKGAAYFSSKSLIIASAPTLGAGASLFRAPVVRLGPAGVHLFGGRP